MIFLMRSRYFVGERAIPDFSKYFALEKYALAIIMSCVSILGIHSVTTEKVVRLTVLFVS